MTLTQFAEVELSQSIVESFESGKFGIKRQPTVIADPAVVFVQSDRSAEERVRCEITFDVFFGYRFVFCIGRLQGEAGPRRQLPA